MLKRDEYFRNVKGLNIIDPRTFNLQIDLGFGVLHQHIVRLSSPILETLDDFEVLRQVFNQDGLRVVVQTTKPVAPIVRLPQVEPTPAEIYINDEPLGHVVARLLAAKTGDIAL